MTQALRRAGHKVTVITPFAQDHPDHIAVPHPVLTREDVDPDSRAPDGQAPDGQASVLATQPEKIQAKKPTLQTRLRNGLRTWLLWPDPEIRWARRAAYALIEAKPDLDWLITTNPPESLHVVGPSIQRALDCRWVAEFRDTWTVAPHRVVLVRSGVRRVLERQIARRALRRVDAVTAVSDAVMAEVAVLAPNRPQLIIGHFSDAPPAPEELSTAELNIVHSGGFELSDRRRKLTDALDALDAAAARRPDRHFRLHIGGPLSAAEQSLLQDRGDDAPVAVTAYGPVSLTRSRALQAGADALLLHTPADSHALPGKYAEYRQARKPIVYLGGGSWMSLVDDPDMLIPVAEGLARLEKGQDALSSGPAPLDADGAAAQLVALLQRVETD